MTRMRHPQSKNYKDKKLSDITEKLTPIEKSLFIANGTMPDYLNQEEQQILKLGKESLIYEFEDDDTYTKGTDLELSSTSGFIKFIKQNIFINIFILWNLDFKQD